MDPEAPRPSFTVSPDSGEGPLLVTVDASASTDNSGITDYAWEFPDGSKASGVTATTTLDGLGRRTIRLTVTDTDGNSATTTRDVILAGQDPYSGLPIAIPGRIECENFDLGGEAIAYHDSDASNRGGDTRSDEGVDIETSIDDGGGYNVGWTTGGEWLEYTVDVASAGTYRLNIRSAGNGSTVRLVRNGADLTPAISLPKTADWQTYATTDAGIVILAAGEQILRLAIDTPGSNLNWFELTREGDAPTRVISMATIPDHVWECDPGGLGNDDGSTTTFTGLDPATDHLLSPTRTINN